MPRTSVVWEYFTQNTAEIACCNICNASISYKTSISNLKSHLQRKHLMSFVSLSKGHNDTLFTVPVVMELTEDTPPDTSSSHSAENSASSPQHSTPNQVPSRRKDEERTPMRKSLVWDYFTEMTAENASCNICQASISFKSTITNLKSHLRRKHPSSFVALSKHGSDSLFTMPVVMDMVETPSSTNNIQYNDMSTSSTPSEGKTTPRKSSEVWDLFSKISAETASCNICEACISYKSTIANLKMHLKRKHNVSFVSSPNSTNDRSAAETTANNEQSDLLHSTSPNNLTAVKKLSPSQKRKIDRDLLDLFFLDFQPFSIVEDQGFKKFAGWIPGYELPSRKTVSSRMVPSLYRKCFEYVKSKIVQEAESICLCITTDCGTSRNNESYLAVTGHYIGSNFEFESVLLKCGSMAECHTSQNLAEQLTKLISDWGLEGRVNFVVCDSDANTTGALEHFLKWEYFGCYTRTLNLIVKNALDSVQPLLEKVKRIDTRYKKNSVALGYPRNGPEAAGKKRLQDGAQGWISTFYKMRSLLELDEGVRVTLAVVDRDLPSINSDEWKTLEGLVEILGPFEEMSGKMSGEQYPTGAMVIVVTRTLIVSCGLLAQSDLNPISRDVLKTLEEGIYQRFYNIEFNTSLALCTLLDPRYKEHIFSDPAAVEEAKNHLQSLVASRMLSSQPSEPLSQPPLAPTNSKVSALNVMKNLLVNSPRPPVNPSLKAIQEMDSYLDEQMTDEGNDNPHYPLEWWKAHRHIYPNLASLLRTKYNIIASSEPCQRLFSKLSTLLNKKRTRLMSKTVEMMMFLHFNSMHYSPL